LKYLVIIIIKLKLQGTPFKKKTKTIGNAFQKKKTKTIGNALKKTVGNVFSVLGP